MTETFRDQVGSYRFGTCPPVFSRDMWDPWAFAEEERARIGFGQLPAKGVYVPAIDCIVLQTGLPAAQERSVLAEELAHRTLGHRPHPSKAEVDRMEERARRWAAVRLVSIADVLEALRSADNIFEIAEHLGVDPELLEVRLKWLTDEEQSALWPERNDDGER